ncbi:MAG: asparagine--tRNA ligase [Defluviitaleaceae bacterium]|nr:asparagine--tRNA ligase [Defluviitaleaceae bacterium]
MYTKCKDIYKSPADYMGKEITLGGWIRTTRSSKGVGFIELNDGTFFKSVQVVFDAELTNGLDFDETSKLGVGACLTIKGQVVESPGAKQPFEIKAKEITLEGACPSTYPLQKKRHGFEFLRTIAHLRPRTNTFAAVFRVRSLVAFAIHEFFMNRGFVYVHTPLLTGSDGEGAGEMFQVTTLPMDNVPKQPGGSVDWSKDFFNSQAYLAVTGQLAVEPFIMGFRDVYTFGPIFRSEKSTTTTHAAEFWMIEPEMAFADLDNYMETAEAMLKHIINYVLENASEEMAFFDQWIEPGLIDRLKAVANADFVKCSYTKAIELLLESGREFEYPVEWGLDMQTEHERYICEEVYNGPVFLTNYPRDIKAFYMRVNEDGKTVAAADLLVPGVGELVGGSQREERLDVLEESIARFGLKQEDYDWYIDLRRFGGVKHAGFGLGFERCLMYITGMKNIRDVVPYPRTFGQMGY